jgi:hypothetical protein
MLQTVAKGFTGTIASAAGYLATAVPGESVVKALVTYGGAVIVVLTIVSLCLDIRAKARGEDRRR